MMRLPVRWLAVSLVFLALAACAWTPAELELKPNATVPSSTVGNGTTLSFKFSDERDDVTIGHRSVATIGAKISSQQLPVVVETQLQKILTAKGYRIVSNVTGGDAEVVYRLRSFKFDIEAGFFTGGRNAAAALAVDARRREKTYTTVYRTNTEERILFVPGEAEINQQMNAALNEILGKAASDSQLDQFLTQR